MYVILDLKTITISYSQPLIYSNDQVINWLKHPHYVECQYPVYRGAVVLTDTFSEVSTSVFFLCLYLAAATVQVGILLQVLKKYF
jgi:hypothetical protein